MKKRILSLILMLVLVFAAVACNPKPADNEKKSTESASEAEKTTEDVKSEEKGKAANDAGDKKVIKLGTTPLIDQICEGAKKTVEDAGYELEIVVISDPVQLNEALQDGSVDLSFYMHEIYMQKFNEAHNANLVKVGEKLYTQVVGLFSKEYKTLDEIKEGDLITIQNDPTNRDRALKLLADCDLIVLDPDIEKDTPYGLADIVENPKNLEFIEVAGQSLVKSLEDTNAAILTGMNAAKAGFFADDALAVYNREDKDKYSLILAAKEGNEKTDWALAVYKGLQTETAMDLVKEVTHGAWSPLFK